MKAIVTVTKTWVMNLYPDEGVHERKLRARNVVRDNLRTTDVQIHIEQSASPAPEKEGVAA